MKKIEQLLLALFLMLVIFTGCQNPAGENNPPKTEVTDVIVLDVSQSNSEVAFKTAVASYPSDNKLILSKQTKKTLIFILISKQVILQKVLLIGEQQNTLNSEIIAEQTKTQQQLGKL